MWTSRLSAPVVDEGRRVQAPESVIQGFNWRMASSMLRLLVQFVVLAILARLLEPRDLGLLGLAVIVTGVWTTLCEMGIGAALIQRSELTSRHLRVGFTLSLGAGVLGMLMLWALAPGAGVLFRDAEIVSVLRFVALVLPFEGVGVVARSLLLRRLDFKREFWAEACASVIGYGGVSLTLALANYGVWAPAAGLVARSIVLAAILCVMAPHARGVLLASREMSEMLHFGAGVSLARIANFMASNADYIVVGAWLGVEALAVYQYAYQIAQVPVSYFTVQVSYVLFPALAGLRADPGRLRSVYRGAMTLVMLLVLPSAVAIAISAPELIPVVLGDRWRRSVLPVEILCLGAGFHAAYNLSDALARASGAVYQQAARHLKYALAVSVGSMLGLRWDLAGVSTGVVVAMVVIGVLMLDLGARLTGHSWLDMGKMSVPGAVLALGTGFGGIAASQVARTLELPQAVSLVLTLLGCGTGAIVGSVWIRTRWFGADVRAMLVEAAQMVPYANVRTLVLRKLGVPGPDGLPRGWLVKIKELGRQIPGLPRAYGESRLAMYAIRNGLWRTTLSSRRGSGPNSPQRVLTWDVGFPPVASAVELENWLQQQGLVIDRGGHTLYLRPQERLKAVLGDWVRLYPPDAGFKILRDLRPPSEASYVTRRWGGPIEASLTGAPAEQLVTGNFLYVEGVSPQVYDLCSLRAGSRQFSAFVVQHVDGDAPTEHQCEQFLVQLAQLMERTDLRVTHPNWRTKVDFQSPSCNGNLLVPRNSRRPLYVDFQAFRLLNASTWVQGTVDSSRNTLHFGDELPSGKRYLYQAIPGRSGKGKRDVRKRWPGIQEQLQQNAVNVEGRLILDVGCNAGMMIAAALGAGALWGIGWDRSSVIRYAEPLLRSLRLTRFTLVAADLDQGYALQGDVPRHLSGLLPESIVFYLSVRQHIGLLTCLEELPWRALVYEGHEGERLEMLEEHVGRLCRRNIRLVSRSYVADGLSGRRPCAILLRT